MQQVSQRVRRQVLLASVGGCALVIGQAPFGAAQAQALVNACSGVSVTLPALQSVPGVASGLLGGVLDPVLNGVVGNVNANLTNALSGKPLSASVLDQNGNVVTPGNCNLAADSVTVNANKGITLGGGSITGLGGPGNPQASAGEINSVALGNGATTNAAATGAVALGRGAAVSSVGGVALGAGSIALRPGLAGGPESFSGTAVSSNAGAVSVGAAGAERQIVNVAGGTQDTDAVNVRQLHAVGSNVATSLGGGASFNTTTGAYTGPTYVIGGNNYTDVGSALSALNSSTFFGNVPIVANNTSGFSAPAAAGSDALAAGFGATASGARAAAFGTSAVASGDGSSAFGSNASATAQNGTAVGSQAAASGVGATALGVGARATAGGAVAIGNTSSAAQSGAVAIGQNSSATAADGVALGRGATVSSIGGVALGTGSIVARAGLAGAAENFSGTAIASTAGAVSVGAAGSERQIVNVAGGTQDSDAVNVRQLRTVGSDIATGLGGGATFNSTTGAYTGPTYVIGGNNYADVGSALNALNSSTFFGSNPIAANNTSGFTAPTATGSDALAVGYGASSSGARAASFGTGAAAGGDGASAFGANANASAQNGTSLGSQSVASGVGATAVGAGATAAADATVAVGNNASATHTGSTAIGAGATTTRANQVAVGTGQSTYTMAGIGSAQSAAAQSGPTRFVTTDSVGNLATSSFDPGAISNQVNGLTQEFTALRKETRQGVASAMAMGAAPMPSAPGKTSWAINTATYLGEWGASISLAHRLNIPANIALTGSVSNSGGNSFGVRVGLAGEF